MCGLTDASKAEYHPGSSAIPLVPLMIKRCARRVLPIRRAQRHSSSLPFCDPQFCP
jgi:hypothetical protein